MSITNSLLDKVVQKKADLEAWKRDHPEMAEGIDLLDAYLEAFDELYRQCHSYQIYGSPVYPSYPVSPAIPWWQQVCSHPTGQITVTTLANGDGSISYQSQASMEDVL